MAAAVRPLFSRLAVVALLVAGLMAVRAFVAQPERVRDASMLPTLWPGDMVHASCGPLPGRRGSAMPSGKPAWS